MRPGSMLKTVIDTARATREMVIEECAAEADRFAAQCLATEPRDQSIYDMGIGAERAAIAIRRLLTQ